MNRCFAGRCAGPPQARPDQGPPRGPFVAHGGSLAVLSERGAVVTTDPTAEQMQRHLRAANAVARRSLAAGHHPFGALLVAPDHVTVLADQGNVDTVNHFENPTLDLPCRTVFASGQKDIRVWGPVPEVEEEIAALHMAFWQRGAG